MTDTHIQTDQGRHQWEQWWKSHRPDDVEFRVEEVPSQLARLLDRSGSRLGRALDLGCGASLLTYRVAERFEATVGIDCSYSALQQAKELDTDNGRPPHFATSDACTLPFRSASFMFVFDRGCLQNLPSYSRDKYFGEVERVLAPGGTYALFYSSPRLTVRRLLRLLVRAEGRRRWRTSIRPLMRSFLSSSELQRLVPTSLAIRSLETYRFATQAGHTRTMSHLVAEKCLAAEGKGEPACAVV